MRRMGQLVCGVLLGETFAFVRSPMVYPEHPEHFYLLDINTNKYSHLHTKKCSGRTGTFRNIPERILFRHVPAMFRPALLPEQGCSPYATRATAIFQKTAFRNVPVVPEHFYGATGRVNQGLQRIDFEMFRMFRTFDSPAHVFRF